MFTHISRIHYCINVFALMFFSLYVIISVVLSIRVRLSVLSACSWGHAQDALRRVTHKFCTTFVWLHDESLARGINNWHATIKLHMMYHQAEDGVRHNPRFGWTYADESFVGTQSDAAQSTVKPGVPCKFNTDTRSRSNAKSYFIATMAGRRCHKL